MPTAIAEIDNAVDGAETPEVDSKYRLIILAAKRSKQLQRGAQPRIEIDDLAAVVRESIAAQKHRDDVRSNGSPAATSPARATYLLATEHV